MSDQMSEPFVCQECGQHLSGPTELHTLDDCRRYKPAPLDEAAIRARHREQPTQKPFNSGCYMCDGFWPCDAAKLLDALAAERALRVAAEDDFEQAAQQVENMNTTMLETEARAERAEREVARLKEAARIVTELLADMHDGCNDGNDWAPQPEKCMACLVFEQSGIATLAAALAPAQPAAEGE